MGLLLVIQFSKIKLGTNFKNCFTFIKKLKMRENIVIGFNFSPVFYMTVLKCFSGDSDRMINPREFVKGSYEHG